MEQELTRLIVQYGLIAVFASMFVEQAGIPVPSLPILVVAGAMSANGRLPLGGVVAAAFVGSLLPDFAWYWAGRRFGTRVIRQLCRISLSRDSCVHKSELHFEHWRGRSLLIAKFVPGLSLVAPPLVGALGLPTRAFVQLDALGALLWIGFAVGLGYAFSAQINGLLAALASASRLALYVVLALLAVYVAQKWWRRHRQQRALRMTRVTARQLHRAMASDRPPVILDVRSRVSRELDPRAIEGALFVDAEHAADSLHGIPFEREIVSYCNCPHEATSATVANALKQRGYQHVRPLLGGLNGWQDAGYAVQHLPPAVTETSHAARGTP